MDTNQIEALNEISNSIGQYKDYDWVMVMLTLLNVIIFGFLTWKLYILNKKISKNQEDLQKRNLKLQLFEKRYPLYLAVKNSYVKSFIDIKDILSGNCEMLENEDFELELKTIHNELKYNNLSAKFLYGDSFISLLVLEPKLFILLEQLSNLKIYFKTNGYEFGLLTTDYYESKIDNNFVFNIWAENSTSSVIKKLLSYSNAQKEYVKYIEDNNILEEFKEYLNVHDLEN